MGALLVLSRTPPSRRWPEGPAVAQRMIFWQILIDGFAISALYALGATGFTLIFGVSGVLNLSHGAIMVAAAVGAWAAAGLLHVGAYAAALIGIAVGMVLAFATYFITVRPIQRSSKIAEAEKEIFILTATLLWGIIVQEAVAYLFTDNAKTVLPIVEGTVSFLGVRTPTNEFFTAAVCWLVIGLLWLLVNKTRRGKAVLAASMNPRGVTLLGIELSSIYLTVWAIYGLLGGHRRHPARHVPRRQLLQRRPAHGQRVLDRGAGRPGQRVGLADRRLRGRLPRDADRLPDLAGLPDDSGAAAAGGRHVRAAAGAVRAKVARALYLQLAPRSGSPSRCWRSARVLPGFASGYVLGLLTVAFYTAVFAMSWDLLFGFAGEVNFGPTFLIGLGAYTAGILDARLSPGISIWLCVLAGAATAVVGGVLLALPALRLRGPVLRPHHAGRGADAAELRGRLRRTRPAARSACRCPT